VIVNNRRRRESTSTIVNESAHLSAALLRGHMQNEIEKRMIEMIEKWDRNMTAREQEFAAKEARLIALVERAAAHLIEQSKSLTDLRMRLNALENSLSELSKESKNW
jgi:hypothetical protein